MNNRVAVLLSLLILVGFTSPVQAVEVDGAYDISIYMNDQRVEFNEDLGYPFIDDANRTQMPLRIILESMGAEVGWDAVNEVAEVVKGNLEIQVPLGASYIMKNNEIIEMDTVSRIINSRIYIPLRAIVEAMGAEVTWDGSARQVGIDTLESPIISRLPDNYDLRTFQRLTGVKDQYDIGACWAFATLGAIESCLLPDQVYDFSEDHMSLTHGYNLSQDEGGDFQISLAYLARWSGPVYEIDDPYGDGETDPTLKASIHVQEAMILPTKDYSAIKRAVIAHGGVQTSIHIRDIQQQELGDAFNPITNSFYYKGQVVPNHDVVIVGWDDGYSVDNFTTSPQRAGAFICRNSYGDYFGDAGYFYVSYEDTWIGDESIVYSRIEGADNYDHIYQSDWLGWVGRIGYGSNTAYFSNVYTSLGEESLEAVSFYATDRDTAYEVYVVPSFTSIEDYQQMVLVAKGIYDYAGYYTVDFDSININGPYAVVVKITTPDSLFPVAAEFYKDVQWLDSIDLEDGQGYMSKDGLIWESTETILESNVALKAFTKQVTPVLPELLEDRSSDGDEEEPMIEEEVIDPEIEGVESEGIEEEGSSTSDGTINELVEVESNEEDLEATGTE